MPPCVSPPRTYSLPLVVNGWAYKAEREYFPRRLVIVFPWPTLLLYILTIRKTLMDTLASIIAPENLHVHAEITSVSSLEYGVKLVEASGAEHIYDHVILA